VYCSVTINKFIYTIIQASHSDKNTENLGNSNVYKVIRCRQNKFFIRNIRKPYGDIWYLVVEEIVRKESLQAKDKKTKR